MTGYTKVPNDFFKWLYDKNLTGLEFKTVLFVFQKTIGWNKESDKISFSQFGSELKATRRGMIKTIKSLVRMGILVKTEGKINSYRLVNSSTLVLVNRKVSTSEPQYTKTSEPQYTHIRNKETIQKGIKILGEGLHLDPNTGLVTKA